MISYTLCTCIYLFSAQALKAETLRTDNNTESCRSDNMFLCSQNPLECISDKLICNGISECANGADEKVSICGNIITLFACNVMSKIKKNQQLKLRNKT